MRAFSRGLVAAFVGIFRPCAFWISAVVTLVHVADERDAAAIRRSGLVLPKRRLRELETECRKYGVFAMPVVDDFMLTYQWVRELARRGYRSSVGVHFRVSDGEPVWAGRYNEAKQLCTAAAAAAALRNGCLQGYEVILPRAVRPAEITAMRPLPAVGWRFTPEAKGRPPFCPCKFCTRGDIKARRLRDRLDPNGERA